MTSDDPPSPPPDPPPDPAPRDAAHATAVARFTCRQCAAELEFRPGTDALVCGYCGFTNTIDVSELAPEELDFEAYLARVEAEQPVEEVSLIKCGACGAETDRPEHLDSFACVFCGSSIVASETSERLIKPSWLLPFHVTSEKAHQIFRAWIAKRWFAPSDLKRYARSGGRVNGVYMPYWTYDSRTVSHYQGSRGEHYYVTETYQTVVNGKTVTRTRQVQKTRWYPAAGTVHNAFDDLLVVASRSLPPKDVEHLTPWDLENLVEFREDFLAGFRAEKYQVDLRGGFDVARQMMEGPIHQTVCRDIGGDVQQVSSVDTSYHDITFKHLLLPVWLSAYTYRDNVYRLLINARTGELRGQRPYSVWKIVLAVLGGLAAAGAIALFVLLVTAAGR